MCGGLGCGIDSPDLSDIFFPYRYWKNYHRELQEKCSTKRYINSRDLQKPDFLVFYMSSITDIQRLFQI